MSDADSLRSILEKKFQNYGGESDNTKLFAHFSEADKRRILEEIEPIPDEMPVLASLLDRERFVLITTNRIVDRRPKDTAVISIDTVTKCETDIFTRAAQVPPRKPGDWAAIERLKDEASEILLTLASGDKYNLAVESGPPYFGILNVLMHLASRYHVRRELAARDRGAKCD